jgi:hypothetical protein
MAGLSLSLAGKGTNHGFVIPTEGLPKADRSGGIWLRSEARIAYGQTPRLHFVPLGVTKA